MVSLSLVAAHDVRRNPAEQCDLYTKYTLNVYFVYNEAKLTAQGRTRWSHMESDSL